MLKRSLSILGVILIFVVGGMTVYAQDEDVRAPGDIFTITGIDYVDCYSFYVETLSNLIGTYYFESYLTDSYGNQYHNYYGSFSPELGKGYWNFSDSFNTFGTNNTTFPMISGTYVNAFIAVFDSNHLQIFATHIEIYDCDWWEVTGLVSSPVLQLVGNNGFERSASNSKFARNWTPKSHGAKDRRSCNGFGVYGSVCEYRLDGTGVGAAKIIMDQTFPQGMGAAGDFIQLNYWRDKEGGFTGGANIKIKWIYTNGVSVNQNVIVSSGDSTYQQQWFNWQLEAPVERVIVTISQKRGSGWVYWDQIQVKVFSHNYWLRDAPLPFPSASDERIVLNTVENQVSYVPVNRGKDRKPSQGPDISKRGGDTRPFPLQ